MPYIVAAETTAILARADGRLTNRVSAARALAAAAAPSSVRTYGVAAAGTSASITVRVSGVAQVGPWAIGEGASGASVNNRASMDM
jgi:hypothetical protein